MSVAGFFLELLIPGAIGSLAILIALLPYLAISLGTIAIPKEHSYLLTALFLMSSYLIGIILRHVPLFERPADFYALRIGQQWPKVARMLSAHLITHLRTIDEGYESGLKCPETSERFTSQQSGALITYLRDYVLSHASTGLCELFNYEWRFSRLARNCAPPLLFLSLACCFAACLGAKRSIYHAETRWLMWALLSGAVLFTLRVASSLFHRWRKKWKRRSSMPEATRNLRADLRLERWLSSRAEAAMANRFLKRFIRCLFVGSFCSLLTCSLTAFFLARWNGNLLVAAYAGGAFVAGFVLVLLRHAYRERINWQVDILMRIGSFMFRFDSESLIEQPSGSKAVDSLAYPKAR